MKVTTVGLDIAKNIFQVHGIDDEGNVIIRRRLRRKQVLEYFAKLPSCLVGLEASGSAHYWARELTDLGHDARIIPPSYVKPYVKRGKNDAVDAAAICEAVGRPTMRFVPIKTEEQQAALMIHKARQLLMRQQVMLANALRSHMAELGFTVARNMENVSKIISVIEDDLDESLPPTAKAAMRPLIAQLRSNEESVKALDEELKAWHKANEISKCLETIPGVGILTASAIAATVPDPSFFKSGREFAAWLGLVPRQNSSGGKERLGSISKQGNRYIRTLLVMGATSTLTSVRKKTAPHSEWVSQLLERRPAKLVMTALANKMARIAWAVMVRQENFRAPALG